MIRNAPAGATSPPVTTYAWIVLLKRLNPKTVSVSVAISKRPNSMSALTVPDVTRLKMVDSVSVATLSSLALACVASVHYPSVSLTPKKRKVEVSL